MENSVITVQRRIQLCRITSGAISSIAPITHIAFGSSGVDSDGEPIMPNDAQLDLKNEIARYPVLKIEYPIETTARYTAEIPVGELAGVKINEAALVDADGVLCAIKNMYTKQKDNDVVFTFTFDDEF